MTYMQAALTILGHADRPLRIDELTAIAVGRGLVHPRGRTPDRTMSSVLYRRMAADADAPITSVAGRFWLRGRPMAAAEPGLRPTVRRLRRVRGRQGSTTRAVGVPADGEARPAPIASERQFTPPVLEWPEIASLGSFDVPAEAAFSTARREQAVARLASRLQAWSSKYGLPDDAVVAEDAEQTLARRVAPLLTVLGYRRQDRRPLQPGRGRAACLLQVEQAPGLLLEVYRPGHALGDGDAQSALARALALDVPWVVLTNSRELRVYAAGLQKLSAASAPTLVLRADLSAWADEGILQDTAGLLWLLTPQASRTGALDAYLASCAVGAALLGSLEDPESAVVQALADAVRARTGLQLAPSTLARHARLAVRKARGRDGEPLPGDITTVAAVRPGSLEAQDTKHQLQEPVAS